MKILITGGAGFIGYYLVKQFLNLKNQVHVVDNFLRGKNDKHIKKLSEQGANFITANILEDKSLSELDKDYDYIIHLAAIIGVSNVLKNPYDVLKNNAIMLFNIISLARKQKHLKKLLFPSTSEVYAGTLKYFDIQIPTPETTPLAITDLKHPRTSYMLSKIYGEALCHAANIPFIIIRPHNIYGPRMGINHVVPEILQKSHTQTDGSELKVYSPKHKRTFCFIDDAIEQIIGLLGSGIANGGTFNIGSIDKEVSIQELAQIIINVTKKKHKILGIEDTPGSPTRRKPDMNETLKIVQKNKWVELQDGIEKCYEWYRVNLFDIKK